MPPRFSLPLIALVLTACAGLPAPRTESGPCQALSELTTPDNAIASLDNFSDLIERSCFREAIQRGEKIRRTYREKSYSVTSEVLSIFVSEDTLSEYVLESYERAYLSLLMAHAYLVLDQVDDAAVELRQAYSESKASLYNFGEDPVNSLVAAVLWERIGEFDSARPYWSNVAHLLEPDDPVGAFADRRIQDLDRSHAHVKPLHIFALGRFPRLDWKIHLVRGQTGYYDLRSVNHVPESCASGTGLLLATDSWLQKIKSRYHSSYHPLLNAKSWIRFPIGVAYGVTAASTGFGLAVGGCVLDASATGHGDLCKASLKAGGYLMASSKTLVTSALRPDLRHWNRVPAAILVSSVDDPDEESCARELEPRSKIPALELAPKRGPLEKRMGP